MPEEPENIENRSTINIRSDEVQEIMSHVPNWMIRWGISLIFVLILLFLVLSWVIKYPDVINGSVQLTTTEPPVKLVTKAPGEIDQIYFEDNTQTNKGDVIAVLNNPLTIDAKLQLEEISLTIRHELKTGTLANYTLSDVPINFGSLQSDYVNLRKTITDYQFLINENNTVFKISNLKKQIHNYSQLKSVTNQQIQTANNQYKKAEEKYNTEKQLYQQGVLSKMELYEEEKKFASAKTEVDALKKSAIQYSISVTDLKKQLNDYQFDFNLKKSTLLEDIQNRLSVIENAIVNWGMNFEITAPIDGKLTYLGAISPNLFVESGKALFAVVPENQEYIGQIYIPRRGYGKVKIGQKVHVKLDNYPYQEYGQLNGVVDEISLLSNEENYLIKVKLIDGLNSTYHKKLTFTPEMSGVAEIVTEDLRLIERIFNKFRQLVDN